MATFPAFSVTRPGSNANTRALHSVGQNLEPLRLAPKKSVARSSRWPSVGAVTGRGAGVPPVPIAASTPVVPILSAGGQWLAMPWW